MTIRQILIQELRHIFKRKSKLALMLFGIPILYGILFGSVYSAGFVRYIPTLIYDQDQTFASRSLIQSFADSERYRITAQVSSQEELESHLADNTALVAITIPPDFTRNIKMGLASEVLVETSASNLLIANTVITTSQEILASYSAGTGQKLVEAAGQMPAQALRTVAPVKLGLRIMNNPTLSYGTFILPGLGVNGLQLAIVIAMCSVLTSLCLRPGEYRDVPPVRLALGKLLPYWLCGFVSFLLYIALIVAFFHEPMKGSLAALLLIGAAFTFCVTGLGAIVSAVAPNEVTAVQLPMLYIMPAFLFSGYSWPQLAMNGFSRVFSAALPLTYTADTLRDIMLAGYAPQLWHDATILIGFGAVLWAAAITVFRLRRTKALNATQEVL